MQPCVSLLNTSMPALGESDYANVKSSFKVMDLFTFDPTSGLVTSLDLIDDTHPIGASAGNKYGP